MSSQTMLKVKKYFLIYDNRNIISLHSDRKPKFAVPKYYQDHIDYIFYHTDAPKEHIEQLFHHIEDLEGHTEHLFCHIEELLIQVFMF